MTVVDKFITTPRALRVITTSLVGVVYYDVWYMRPEYFRDGIMGVEWCKSVGRLPDVSNLENTHVQLTQVAAINLDDVFFWMQGENWSPYGEAQQLIMDKGLKHTSMTVGDVVTDQLGNAWIVDVFGFTLLTQ